ncbi:hypothetical protein CASFOL_001210 [Castilleja foliolosa]|uniref:Uncharacterized protein n=1 Tax=Castilleja foliolosa TaxID=1961234 RepID=A0ABD3EMG2_9LAMI
MSVVCGIDDVENGGDKCLEALALRKRAEDEMGRVFAIDLKPFGGAHIMYKDRSAARLGMGDINGALEDIRRLICRERTRSKPTRT